MTTITLASLTKKSLLLIILSAVLPACDRGGDTEPVSTRDLVSTDDPDKFLQFINPQFSLPVADNYQLVIGTQTINQTGSYSAVITPSNGISFSCEGTWPNNNAASGPNAADAGNSLCSQFNIKQASGIEVNVSSDIDTCIYLLNANGDPVPGTSDTACLNQSNLNLPLSRIDFDGHGEAYYEAIDPPSTIAPNGTRNTLQSWAEQNGFDFVNENPNFNCSEASLIKYGRCGVNVKFRDTKDLGYGRDMYLRREDRCNNALNDAQATCSESDVVMTSLAVYVKNFQVDAIPGLQYSALNYESLVQNDLQWHFGSNAIEFSTYPYGNNEPLDGSPEDDGLDTLFTKFYTFDADQDNFTAPETRLNSVDLDSRGSRSMPTPCISCHGGKTKPLLPDGTLAPPYPSGLKGDTEAKLQAIEIDSLGFPNPGDAIPAEQEEGLAFINQAIYDSYIVSCEQNDDGNNDGLADNDLDCKTNPSNVSTQGKWNPTGSMEWLAGSYSGVDANGKFNSSSYDNSFVPSDWKPNLSTGSPAAGADTLFLEVVKPNCLVCHGKRGNDNQLSGSSNGSINFENYSSFINHAEQIEDYVYEKGVMPLGILNFDQFWDNISPNKPALLASYLPSFNRSNADGSVIQPGKPVASIAAPKETRLAPMKLSASGSAFTTEFAWTILNRPVNSASTSLITDSDTAWPTFTPDVEGSYEIQLVATNSSEGQVTSDTTSTSINVSESITSNNVDLRSTPSEMRFDPHIKNILQGLNNQNLGGTRCAACHSSIGTSASSVRQIPIHFTDTQLEGRDLYLESIQKVNFADPLLSLLLRRPSGNQHPGGCLPGFDIYEGDETERTDNIPNCDGIEDDQRNYDQILTWILQGAPK